MERRLSRTAKAIICLSLASVLALALAACGSQETEETAGTDADTTLSKLDMSAWQYDADDGVYYQVGVSYCEDPADESYETLAVFVPGAYMTGTENADGTYTCEIDSSATVNGYTAETAPIVMPINTPGYSAQSALTGYKSSVSAYTDEGFIYVHAGCRGRDEGAPAGVTDLKAAIRYLRYCDDGTVGEGDVLVGDSSSIFTFGMSGGGAQSAIVGSTGDSALYEAYLEEIGAVSGYSDAVLGSMCWCPITNLDTADEAYEWMMGTTRSGLSDEEQAISDALAEAYAAYVNEAGIKDADGNTLTLEESSEGIYQAGSYYEYMKSVIEGSLNNFLSDTEFPYSGSSGSSGGPGDGITRNDSSSSSSSSSSATYETAQDYIDALNADGEWISYDSSSNTATITSIEDFVKACKTASKNLGAFDQLDGGQGENTLFGYGDGEGAHFDSTLATILSELGNSNASDYADDLEKADSVGNTVETRVNMYTPLYYLLESSDGYGTSAVAKYWRIRTGIAQGDCALSTEMNLALVLENYADVESVDFETVWGAGHTQAERSGSSSRNFISWVNECMSAG